MCALPRIYRAGGDRAGRREPGGRDSPSADRALQDPRRLLRRQGAGSSIHFVGDDGHDPFAPCDALAGVVRSGVPPIVPHILRRTGTMEPLCPAAQLPAAQRVVAGLHGRPADRRLRVGRVLFGRLRCSRARHGGRSEAQNPLRRKLCPLGPGRTVCSEAARYDRHGDGRHERLPRGAAQGAVSPHPLRRIRRGADSLGIRHGRTHLAGLLARRQPVPLPGMDACHGPRRQRSVPPTARRGSRRTEHHRPGQPLVVRLHRDAGCGARLRRRIVRDRRPHRPRRHPGVQSFSTMQR